MKDHIKFETGLKRKVRESFPLKIRRFFGFTRRIYHKTKNFASTTRPLTYRSAKILEEQQIEAEQRKAKAIALLYRRPLTT